MSDRYKEIDPLPESFQSEEEAAELWHNHSLTDYEQYLEPCDDLIEIKERVFER